jgi:hypothetical protein
VQVHKEKISLLEAVAVGRKRKCVERAREQKRKHLVVHTQICVQTWMEQQEEKEYTVTNLKRNVCSALKLCLMHDGKFEE